MIAEVQEAVPGKTQPGKKKWNDQTQQAITVPQRMQKYEALLPEGTDICFGYIDLQTELCKMLVKVAVLAVPRTAAATLRTPATEKKDCAPRENGRKYLIRCFSPSEYHGICKEYEHVSPKPEKQ